MAIAPSPSSLSVPGCRLHLHSSFLSYPLNSFSPSPTSTRIQAKAIRAELDQNTVVAITVGVVSVAVGIGIPVFYESQIDNAVNTFLLSHLLYQITIIILIIIICCRLREKTRNPASHAMALVLQCRCVI
ncbi:protein disulfide-isomerase LQY1, chloroplastic isoform X2 [Arachis stenosperma]|uniref:protein disulfide-isomerase LQY1, chloroplastic isoform X2 n=1 Tax=Arachis stenosperma TaxID=217475 RepID=UPI0025AC9F96|nr:protein disulfide-isomerase LQY1, chloroplastic isoform X2 [Arachis stenosperma]